MVTKIMPLGASNTYGMYKDPTSPGGYRGPLQYMLQAQGASFDFVGVDHDGAIADPDHNGHSGETIDWYINPVNEAIYDPNTATFSHRVDSGDAPAIRYFLDQAGMGGDDVVLLLLGTNNLAVDDASTMLSKMGVLLDLIVNYSSPGDGESPLVQLMKLQPVGADPSSAMNRTVRDYNAGLEALVATRYGALGVTLVDSGITAEELVDGVHMSLAGYRKTAAAWYDSLMPSGLVDVLLPSERPHLGTSLAERSSRPINEIEPGDAGPQRVVGTQSRDLLDGGQGRDVMRGRGKDDTYLVDHPGDRVVERAGGGIDTVKTDLGAYILPRHIENLTSTHGHDNRLVGNDLDNILRGGDGKDRLIGGRGGDVLLGGRGADVFVLRAGEAQDDRIYFRAGDCLRLEGFGPGAVLVENHTPVMGPNGFHDPQGDWSISYRGRVEVIRVNGDLSLTEGADFVFV